MQQGMIDRRRKSKIPYREYVARLMPSWTIVFDSQIIRGKKGAICRLLTFSRRRRFPSS
jgi:hypothetical protein